MISVTPEEIKSLNDTQRHHLLMEMAREAKGDEADILEDRDFEDIESFVQNLIIEIRNADS